ncbi:MAG: hypothetical protein ABI036_03640 [Fibrobacteria bacterium]
MRPDYRLQYRRLRAFCLCLCLSLCWSAGAASAADLQPRSYPYLFSHAEVVAVGRVTAVSSGFMTDNHNANVAVEGFIKGRAAAGEMTVVWDEKEFEETAFKRDARVILFVSQGRDSTWWQVSPGVSCWPVEKIAWKGKQKRVVEYAYPLDLVTEIPASAIAETDAVEKTLNFQVDKRKRWILTDALLPPVKPLPLPKVESRSAKPKGPASRKPAGGKTASGQRKSVF